MRKSIALFVLIILLTGCGVAIKSVVDAAAVEKPYRNPLIVIPYTQGSTRAFSNKLKQKLELQFKAEQKSVEILLLEQSGTRLTLNANSGIDKNIDDAIVNGHKDLLLIFNPTELRYVNGGLQSVTYELVGIDTHTQREVWKATFSARSTYGPALFAKKSANTIIQKLKTDKVF